MLKSYKIIKLIRILLFVQHATSDLVWIQVDRMSHCFRIITVVTFFDNGVEKFFENLGETKPI